MNRWQLVQELFAQTAELTAPERARVLQSRTEGDDALAQEVEALVAAHTDPLPELDGTAIDLLEDLRSEPPAEELCGEKFGPYRIKEHLSSGGMGHVYRATRTSAGTERRVALKVLRPGLDTEAFLKRFQLEREMLAGLEHQHIVSFLDAGALPDGRPYLVMEFVEGVPLTDWGRGVPPTERLRLFLEVLAAVQYAHRNLVVHRDLKPSNVLVTAQGTPVLFDFGVATALESKEPETGGRSPLTPAYASPEELRGEPPTTASDVYSLGVLLHELMTGVLPGTPATDRAHLSSDLRAIVHKAIATDTEHRYRSADQMADDIRRHMTGEAISARPATWAYRGLLFARRNRWPLALAGAVILALIAGWVGSDLDRRAAEQEASLGWGAHSQAKVVARVLEGWIASEASTDPELGSAATAHLEQALREDLQELPEAETLIRITLGNLYLLGGDHERAAIHAERAQALASTTRGVGDADRERADDLLVRIRGK